MRNYTTQPSSKQDATKRVNEIKKFLDKETGVKWQTRVWENLGWHCALCYGTLSVYPHYWGNHPNPKCNGTEYHVMNGATAVWTGHVGLSSPSVNSKKRLIDVIRESLSRQKKLVQSYINGYNSNNGLKQFVPLTKI